MSPDRIPNIITAGDPFSWKIEEVRVNGRKINKAFYVHRSKGVVRAFRDPITTDKHRKRLLVTTYRGKVEVILRE